MTTENRHVQIVVWLSRFSAFATAIVVVGILLAACGAETQVTAPEATAEAYADAIVAEAPAAASVTVSEIVDNPDAYLGQTVTVTGEVSDIIYEAGFLLSGSQLPSLGNEIVVLYTEETRGITLHDHKNVQVTGTVRRVDRVELERDYALDLHDDFYRDLADRTAIIATAVRAPL